MKLKGADRERFMRARGEATAATGYYRTVEDAYSRDSTHKPLIPLEWTDADFAQYRDGWNFVQVKRLELQIIQRDAQAVLKEVMTIAQAT